MKKYICIHGHFYQPPRENPWLDVIERQDSAYPYHDWNQRVDAECYTPNTAARILDAEQYIVELLNNYEYISFNFGPTLMRWLERYSPATYRKIIEADTASVHRNNGHGNAIAQIYNHIIMPLATRKDKEIQVKWAIEDFRYHFHRDPEGMWLSETAVDTETLEVLADHGIKFTILSPYQARRFRKLGSKRWIEVQGGIDCRFPYLCRLPGGKSIVLFFYDGPIAQDIAFGGLLNSGEAFFQRLLGVADAPLPFSDVPAVLVNVATDGETYGHHHKFGEMGLAYAIKRALEHPEVEITNYSVFLAKFPPMFEVEIWENTSWSCAHGVERWRSDCGCKIGGNEWNQKWRTPLRRAMDRLREITDGAIGEVLREYGDPDALLKDYIQVMLKPHLRREWLEERIGKSLSREERVRIWKALEAGKFSLFIFTSCAWFFDEISGLEATQILTYAVRCIELLEDLGFDGVEEEIKSILAEAKSNIKEFHDGAWIYENFAKVRRRGIEEMSAHFAIYNLFLPLEDNPVRMYVYAVDSDEFYRDAFNDYQISVGRLKIGHLPTEEERAFEFVVFYSGAHDVRCSLKEGFDDAGFGEFINGISSAFRDHNLTELIRRMDLYFGHSYYGMDVVVIDERQKILDRVVKETLVHFEETFESLFDAYQIFFEGLRALNYSLPFTLTLVIQQVLNRRLKSLLASGSLDDETYSQVIAVIEEIEGYGGSVEVGQVKEALERILEGLVVRLSEEVNREVLADLLRLLELSARLRIQVNLWELQNVFIHYNKEARDKILPDLKVLWEELGRRIRVRV